MGKIYGNIDYGYIESMLYKAIGPEYLVYNGFDLSRFWYLSFATPLGNEYGPYDPNNYWKLTNNCLQCGGGYIEFPENIGSKSVEWFKFRSKYMFKYPRLTAYAKLPSLNAGQFLWLGFEDFARYFNGIVSLKMGKDSSGNWFAYFVSGCLDNNRNHDISFAITESNSQSYNNYSIIITKYWVKLTVNNALRAILINTSSVPPDIAGPPYLLGSLTYNLPERMLGLIELVSQNSKSFKFYLSPLDISIVDGESGPDGWRLFLWQSETVMSGYSLSSGSATSHPFPTIKQPTILFQADTDGTVDIEIYTINGNWRTYDSVDYTANNLLSYVMTGKATFTRIVYTPSSYSATINDAEVIY